MMVILDTISDVIHAILTGYLYFKFIGLEAKLAND